MKQLHDKLRQIAVISLEKGDHATDRRLERNDLTTPPVLIFDHERVNINTKPLNTSLFSP